MKKVVIIGANSAIAKATAKHFAARGDALYLLARSVDSLEAQITDLGVRGAKSIDAAAFDANDLAQHAAVLDAATEALGGLDLVLIAHGSLPDQAACEKDWQLTMDAINTNAISTVSLLSEIANRFEAQGGGQIAVISSVAGDRGRSSNYVYGAAKGMVSIFLQGLRARLFKANVQVLDIKPGFVDTPMTADIPKGGPLWAQPEDIASAIIKALDKGKDEIYTPIFWWAILTLIKHLPNAILKRLSF